MYKIRIKKQAEKKLQKMPISIQDTFLQLVDDLKKPVRSSRDGKISVNWEIINITAIFHINGLPAGDLKKIH
jgi:mRNA-degrading endonuclease RelE of RelBE toxin-antitoxin system